ncbi:MAG: hypothetical protein ABIO72_05425 [Patescibacteria group bacterium]
MNLPPLVLPSYWFALTPPPIAPIFQYILVGVFGACLIAAIVLRLVAMRDGIEKLMRRALGAASNRLIVLAVFGAFLYAMSYEGIYVLSMRFGFILWAALFAWYAWQTYKTIKRDIPAMNQRRTERDAINKWLPKANK